MFNQEVGDIFNKQKINYTPPVPITHLVVCNNFLVLALKSCKLLTIALQDQGSQTEITVPSTSGGKETILYVHLSPNGEHLIVSLESGSVFYLHKKDKKLKPLQKFKGHIVSAVGWNADYCKSASTGFTLFGTTKGAVLESDVTETSSITYLTELFTVAEERPVTDLKLCKISTDPKHISWLIAFSSGDRLYAFVGNVSSPGQEGCLRSLFTKSQGASIDSYSIRGIAPGLNTMSTKLRFYPEITSKNCLQYAWLQTNGVQYGKIDKNSADLSTTKCFTTEKFYDLARGHSKQPAIDICLTEYHMLVLLEDQLNIICTINFGIVQEDILNKSLGTPVGMCRDQVSGIIWLFTDKSVFKYTSTEETRNLWSIYLSLGDYNMARKFAADNSNHLDIVLQRQCAKLLAEKKFVAAAETYATTSAPLEDVALKLMMSQNRTALKTYLQRKLDNSAETDRTQKAMLVFWLLEILLTELDEAKSGLAYPQDSEISEHSSKIQGFDPHKTKELRDYLKMFLKKADVIECLKNTPNAAVQLISSHGDVDTLLYFSELIKDYESVISYYVQQERYDEAVGVLNKQKNTDLYYKFSASILPYCPSALVDSWMNMGASLKPKYILTRILQCNLDSNIASNVIQYFEYHIDKLHCSDRIVHNYLISLYAQHKPDRLLTYLEKEGKDPTTVRYDVHSALRISLEHKLSRATVFLYCLLAMYDDAMNLALQIDSELCNLVAKSPISIEVQRRLWLIYARNVIENNNDVRSCVDLIQSSNGLIKIQDLLPFFPDFVTIDNFKDCLCDCLAEHSGTIKNLQMEMKEASEVAKQIKKDILDVGQKYVTIKPKDKCSSCDASLEQGSIYVFLCHHIFHQRCLQQELEFLDNEEKTVPLKECIKRLKVTSTVTHSDDSASSKSETSASLNIETTNAREELDSILSAECPYCGPMSVESIDKPFFKPADYFAELKRWE